MESVRLRLVFEDRHLLTKTQKSQGLKRSWILLKPELETISDLASHLTHSFDLHSTCPNGLRISMDGFVLPSFESTHIFKDKDIIRVKRKEGAATDIVGIVDEPNSLEEPEVVEKRPVSNGVKLLALEEFQNETGGYQSEPEDIEYDSPEEMASKKRKSSKKLHNSKRKRIKSISPENSSKVSVKGVENDVHLKDQSVCRKGVLSQKSLDKNKLSKTSSKLKKARTTDVGNIIEDNVEHIATKERYHNLQGNGEKDLEDVPEGTKKGPSRSARRKKAKRKWLKELLNSQKNELIQSEPDKVVTKYQERQESDEKTDTEAEIVPIVVRPGHIRFEPLDKDQVVQQTHNPEGNFQWNGITSKRKGQKWGMEKTSVSRSNDYEDLREGPVETENFAWNGITSKSNGEKWGMEKAWNGITSKRNGQKWGMEKSSVSRSNGYEDLWEDSVETENFAWNGVSSKRIEEKWATGNTSKPKSIAKEDSRDDSLQKLNIEERELLHDSVDFEKLNILSGLPKEGDVIAYRLVELSSTWCPELSAFRVGKVSWFDSTSNIVMLVPVPGYPVVSDEKRDEETAHESDAHESDTSLYMEDGSLEIDFTSLVDVRIFNNDNPDPVSNKGALVSNRKAPVFNKDAPVSNKEATVSSKGALLGVTSNDKIEERNVRTTENGGSGNAWEEISQVLSEKKAQLSKDKESWTQKGSPDKTKWSYRALRGSALGPVMARLRAGDDL